MTSRNTAIATSVFSLLIAGAACEAPDPAEGNGIEKQQHAVTAANNWAILLAHGKAKPEPYEPSFFQSSATGITPTVTRLGVGNYSVKIPFFTSLGGNVQVNATNDLDGGFNGGDSNRCNIQNWTISPSGTLVANVWCQNAAGAATDSVFAFNYQRREPGGIEPFVGAYAWNFRASGSGSLDSVYHWNSRGGINRITHVSPGVYLVTLPGLAVASTPGTEGSGMVTRYGGNGYCKIGTWFNSLNDRIIQVRCFSAAGNPENSMFTLAWGNFTPLGTLSVAYALADQPTNQDLYPPAAATRQHMFRGTIDPDNRTEADRLSDTATRRYWITFPNTLLSRNFYNAFVVAFGADNTYCKPVHWPGLAHTTGAAVYNNCFTPSGTLTDSQYVINYAGR